MHTAPPRAPETAPASGATSVHLRLIDEGAQDPARNMALDEALLLAAAQPVLRLYGWAPDAVSLGYFQHIAEFADVAESTRMVRRLTGGGAIHHGDELTFGLAIDAALLPQSIDDSYALLHDAVIRALQGIGVAATRVQGGHTPSARPHDRWCFATAGHNDLVDAEGRKLVGSAQRRIRTADGRLRVLHHGSIVLQPPHWTPDVAAVAHQTDPVAARQPLAESLPREIASALALDLRSGQCSESESEVADKLQRERYEALAFLRTR
ncbi:MAG: hypothetical protein VYE77_04755 [Planctomycetota bacterium]|nr:hypothetical protein [Planctomycetota bacterium]